MEEQILSILPTLLVSLQAHGEEMSWWTFSWFACLTWFFMYGGWAALFGLVDDIGGGIEGLVTCLGLALFIIIFCQLARFIIFCLSLL